MKNPAFSIPRNDPRIYVDLPVRLRFGWKWSEEMDATVVDISDRGLCVRGHAPLRLGLEVAVILAGDEDNAKHYTVLWVRDSVSKPHAVDIGLQLKTEAPDELPIAS